MRDERYHRPPLDALPTRRYARMSKRLDMPLSGMPEVRGGGRRAPYGVQRGSRGVPGDPARLHRGRGRTGVRRVVRGGPGAPRLLLQAR
ncbi:protein of unknown function [Streptomyces murinus]